MSAPILAVILFVMQAPIPIPREAPNHPASARTSVQKQTQNKQKQSNSTSPIINQGQAKAADRDTSQQHDKDANDSVVISKLPPVTVLPVRRDWIDWGYWGFSGLLVLVGAFQVRILMKQTKIIEQQTSLPNRARLIIGNPECSDSGVIRIPIENRGFSNASITSIKMTLVNIHIPTRKKSFKKTIKKTFEKPRVINSGSTITSFFLQNFPNLTQEKNMQILVSGEVLYDASFGIVDKLNFARTYIVNHKTWAEAGAQ